MSTQPTFTPGPWFWDLNLKARQVRLSSVRGGQLTVLDATRWGMNGAQLRFRDSHPHQRMAPSESFAAPVTGREHHADWFQGISHPDARLIAASPDLYAACDQALALLEQNHAAWCLKPDGPVFDALRSALAKAHGEQGGAA